MKRVLLTSLLALAACTAETTSFRATDASDPSRPTAAMHAVSDGVRVDVWSNGGYIGASDEPMTHVGFEVRNTTATQVVFDSDSLALAVFDKRGATLAPARFVAVTPLGAAKLAIGAGETKTFDAYFLIPVTPRAIETMRVRWQLWIGNRAHAQTSSFVRDDDYPVLEPPASPST